VLLKYRYNFCFDFIVLIYENENNLNLVKVCNFTPNFVQLKYSRLSDVSLVIMLYIGNKNNIVRAVA